MEAGLAIHAELLAEVPDVFADGLGKLKEMQVKINVKSVKLFHDSSKPDPSLTL